MNNIISLYKYGPTTPTPQAIRTKSRADPSPPALDLVFSNLVELWRPTMVVAPKI